MKNRSMLYFTIISFIIGLMIAVQFQTVNEPAPKDTRDIWELRQALTKELDLQSRLINEIRSNELKIHDYESEILGSKEEALKGTISMLKEEAGLTTVSGPGIKLTVEPVHEALLLGEEVEGVSPVILKRLVNELNRYGAKNIAIDGERLINSTVIRDINGETVVGTHTLQDLPFEIYITADNMEQAGKIYNRMQISPSIEDFFIDNLRVKISQPMRRVSIPAYSEPIRIRGMEPVNEKGEK